MQTFNDSVFLSIQNELETLFTAHHAVGLEGKICLYTLPEQKIWRAEKAGTQFWFDKTEIPQALGLIKQLYNNGALPNTPLLLHPILHTLQPDGTLMPQGSGVIWSTAFCLGIAKLENEQIERIHGLNVATSPFHRGENERAGLKMVAFSDKPLPAKPGDMIVAGCLELYNVAHIESTDYAPYYLLSGLQYLCTHGLFGHPSFEQLANHSLQTPEERSSFVKKHTISADALKDASQSWDAYDHHHSLYKKFGTDTGKIEHNLKFFNMCARDISLFDATGVRHLDANTQVGFDFIVDGWIPKGAVTVIGASGGTGKSSLAHNLAVKASIDYAPGETPPTWLGSPIRTEACKGIVVYFSGEDGPAIVHARAKVFDPEGRSERLMMQRTDFGEGVTLAGFLKKLRKLPEVSLVVIDPARKYLTGDENDAGVVSEFFEAIEEFAINKGAAVVVVHHLAKGARPQHVSEIYDLLRGSQVFIDRPRVVIGMYRQGAYTIAGLAKNNIPPQLGMIQGERVYRRNEAKLELEILPGAAGIRMDNISTDEDA